MLASLADASSRFNLACVLEGSSTNGASSRTRLRRAGSRQPSWPG